MFPGLDPQHLLTEVGRRQAEVRAEVRTERASRRPLRALGGRLSAFRIWRLHVMVWVEDARGTSRSVSRSARS